MSEKTARAKAKDAKTSAERRAELIAQKNLEEVKKKAQADKDAAKEKFDNAKLVWDRQLKGQVEARSTVQGWLAVHQAVIEMKFDEHVNLQDEVQIALSIIPLLKEIKEIVAAITYEAIIDENFEDPFNDTGLINKDFIRKASQDFVTFAFEAIHFEVVRSMANEIFSCRSDIMMALEQADKDVSEAMQWIADQQKK